MSYLLDSNVLIAILNNRPQTVRDRWLEVSDEGGQVATSSIVIFELMYGAHKSARPKENIARLNTLLSSSLEVLPFDLADAEHAGLNRAILEAAGPPIGPFDLLIAGQALRNGLTLVTANTKEFARVKGLVLENWEEV
ncbi:MAG: type II toxin-antitoxin system VapC family toxin [Hyphomicrobiaceae bacterium]|nr:type II toxin-antitoxin system VapC family toxin [Hyphomicrobiaceae bacterium]